MLGRLKWRHPWLTRPPLMLQQWSSGRGAGRLPRERPFPGRFGANPQPGAASAPCCLSRGGEGASKSDWCARKGHFPPRLCKEAQNDERQNRSQGLAPKPTRWEQRGSASISSPSSSSPACGFSRAPLLHSCLPAWIPPSRVGQSWQGGGASFPISPARGWGSAEDS